MNHLAASHEASKGCNLSKWFHKMKPLVRTHRPLRSPLITPCPLILTLYYRGESRPWPGRRHPCPPQPARPGLSSALRTMGIVPRQNVIVFPGQNLSLFHHWQNVTGEVKFELRILDDNNSFQIATRTVEFRKKCESGCLEDCNTGIWMGSLTTSSKFGGDFGAIAPVSPIAGSGFHSYFVQDMRCNGTNCPQHPNLSLTFGGVCYGVYGPVPVPLPGVEITPFGAMICWDAPCSENISGSGHGISGAVAPIFDIVGASAGSLFLQVEGVGALWFPPE